jgi:hypothetical protein
MFPINLPVMQPVKLDPVAPSTREYHVLIDLNQRAFDASTLFRVPSICARVAGTRGPSSGQFNKSGMNGWMPNTSTLMSPQRLEMRFVRDTRPGSEVWLSVGVLLCLPVRKRTACYDRGLCHRCCQLVAGDELAQTSLLGWLILFGYQTP